jgi:excinuclease ABC subunit A
VAGGPPEDIVRAKRSYRGQFLKPVLERDAGARKRKRFEAAE